MIFVTGGAGYIGSHKLASSSVPVNIVLAFDSTNLLEWPFGNIHNSRFA